MIGDLDDEEGDGEVWVLVKESVGDFECWCEMTDDRHWDEDEVYFCHRCKKRANECTNEV